MIYFTSDLHFHHSKPFLYEPRGFTNIWDHDRAIIENWNKIIDLEDDIYCLGDLMLEDNNYGLSCLKQLKGNIHVVRGNHDSDIRMQLYETCWNVVETCEGKFLRYGKYHFYLSHYPCIVSNYDKDKPLKARTISLCGHSHTPDRWQDFDKGLIYHCELDSHSMTPISIDYIIEDIKQHL